MYSQPVIEVFRAGPKYALLPICILGLVGLVISLYFHLSDPYPSTTRATAAMTWNSEPFFQAVEARRTYYGITATSPIPDAQIQDIVERAVKHAPTSYNMQEGRAVVVTGEWHRKVWDKVKEIRTQGQDEEHAATTSARIDGAFMAGYGTVLFFSDQAVLEQWGERMPPAAKAFLNFSLHATGILQYIVWTALEKEGLGASLQHYAEGSPEVNEAITKLLGLPEAWTATALMPFGTPAAEPQPKTFSPVEERVKVFFDSASPKSE